MNPNEQVEHTSEQRSHSPSPNSVWFKNLRLYRLTLPLALTVEQLAEGLEKLSFQGCGSQDRATFGWLPPRQQGSLVYTLNGQWLICLGMEQKILPAGVINQICNEKAQDIEAAQGYRPGRKQMQELREQTEQELLPRAFSQRRRIYAWIDPQAGWFIVDAASAGKADLVVEALLKSVNMPLNMVRTDISAGAAMTAWLSTGEIPGCFSIDRDCELKSPGEDKSVVRYLRHNLDNDEVRAHLASGKQPTRLALTLEDRISFVLTDQLEIKRLAFLDIIQEEGKQQSVQEDDTFDSSFVLMTEELKKLLLDLLDALSDA